MSNCLCDCLCAIVCAMVRVQVFVRLLVFVNVAAVNWKKIVLQIRLSCNEGRACCEEGCVAKKIECVLCLIVCAIVCVRLRVCVFKHQGLCFKRDCCLVLVAQ